MNIREHYVKRQFRYFIGIYDQDNVLNLNTGTLNLVAPCPNYSDVKIQVRSNTT